VGIQLVAENEKTGRKEKRTATAAAWVKKPTKLNLISPWLVSATPILIISTMIPKFLDGSWMRNVHEMIRMATGVNACTMALFNERKIKESRGLPSTSGYSSR
jgi:hypothetical protein